MFDWGFIKSKSYKIPIICVGNIALGGTGKTPHVEYLINLLKDKFKVAVLSRGYGRNTSGFIIADNKMTYKKIGDEPMQYLHKYPEIIVSVDEDRCEGVERLLRLKKEQRPDVILLDDAYQHRRIRPGLNILLTDFHNIYSKDDLVPAGTLRDIKHAAKRADIIIVTKSPSVLSPYDRQYAKDSMKPLFRQKVFFSSIRYKSYCPLNKFSQGFDPENASNVLLFCGIANPELLLDFLRRKHNNITTFYFNDHHCFTREDVKKIVNDYKRAIGKDTIVVTTEKDAMRLVNTPYFTYFKNIPIYSIPIEVYFSEKDNDKFNSTILDYVEGRR